MRGCVCVCVCVQNDDGDVAHCSEFVFCSRLCAPRPPSSIAARAPPLSFVLRHSLSHFASLFTRIRQKDSKRPWAVAEASAVPLSFFRAPRLQKAIALAPLARLASKALATWLFRLVCYCAERNIAAVRLISASVCASLSMLCPSSLTFSSTKLLFRLPPRVLRC